MPIFDSLSYATPESLYMGKPVQEVKALNKALSDDFINNYNEIDKLDILSKNLDVRDVDYQAKKDAIENIKNQFNKFAEKGDYENATFAVAKAKKEFETNQLLNAVKKNKQLEVSYYQDLNKRKDEGKLRDTDYEYASYLSNVKNNKKVELDPITGKPLNMFNGVTVLDDQTKQIYDDTFKSINDWKEGSIVYGVDKNGEQKTYKLDKLKGITIDQITGKEVAYEEVYNALKTKVETTYKNFLNQEKQVENFNTFFNKETGEFNSITRDYLPMSNDNILKMVTGYSEQDLKTLEKLSKNNLARLTEYEKAKYNRDKFDFDSEEDLTKAYQIYQDKKLIDKYIHPAADKAAYSLEEHKTFTDEASKIALQHSYDKKLKDYENNLNSFPTSMSEIQELSVSQIEDAHKEGKSLNDNLNKLTQEYNKVIKDPNASDVYKANAKKAMEDAQFAVDMHNTAEKQTYENYSRLNPKVGEELLSYGFADLLKEYDKNPTKYSSNIAGVIAMIKSDTQIEKDKLEKRLKDLQYYKNPNISGKEKLIEFINNPFGDKQKHDPQEERFLEKRLKEVGFEAVKKYSKQLLNAVNSNQANKTLFDKAVSNLSKYNNVPSTMVEALEETREKNKELKTQYQSKIIGIDPNSDKAWERGLVDRVTDVVKNGGQSFIYGDENLDQILSGESKLKFFSSKDDGSYETLKSIQIDNVRPEYGHPDGKPRVSITFKDSKGKPVYKSTDDKKSVARMSFIASDESSLNNVYLQLADNLIKSDDGNAQKQALELIHDVKFAPYLKNVRLSGMAKNSERLSKIPTTQGEITIKVVKRSEGDTENEVFDVYQKQSNSEKYEPLILRTSNGTQTYSFKSVKDFGMKLAQNGY